MADNRNFLGKRYRCEACGIEVLCTKAGDGMITCCNQPMTIQEPKPLPSSD
jgi:desulfoferrodoxin-like iron-binding protein